MNSPGFLLRVECRAIVKRLHSQYTGWEASSHGYISAFLVHFTENLLYWVLISLTPEKEETTPLVNTGVDKDSMAKFNRLI